MLDQQWGSFLINTSKAYICSEKELDDISPALERCMSYILSTDCSFYSQLHVFEKENKIRYNRLGIFISSVSAKESPQPILR